MAERKITLPCITASHCTLCLHQLPQKSPPRAPNPQTPPNMNAFQFAVADTNLQKEYRQLQLPNSSFLSPKLKQRRKRAQQPDSSRTSLIVSQFTKLKKRRTSSQNRSSASQNPLHSARTVDRPRKNIIPDDDDDFLQTSDPRWLQHLKP